jgi:hypothetical protein
LEPGCTAIAPEEDDGEFRREERRPAVTEARERLLLLEAVPAIKRVGRQP